MQVELSLRALNDLRSMRSYLVARSPAGAEAVRRALDLGFAQRDEIVVSTKGGYIPLEGEPPASRELYQQYQNRLKAVNVGYC